MQVSKEMHFLRFFPKGHFLPWEVEARGQSQCVTLQYLLNLLWKTRTMTQVFYLLALRFICLFFSSVLAQVEVDRSLFRLNIFPSQCCHLFSQRCLLHSLDLIFKLPAWFSSQSTCVLIPPPLVRTSEGCQKGFVLRVSSLNPDVFNLFLSHLTSNRYFCRTLASSIRKQLVFVHLPY